MLEEYRRRFYPQRIMTTSFFDLPLGVERYVVFAVTPVKYP